jgi:putative ribosome biogenesis GTPase RsgA
MMVYRDYLAINNFDYGDLILSSKVFEDGKNVITNSCDNKITSNVFFGKAGVGKSSVASLVSSEPGLFEVGTSGHGTTTLGTWISSQS